MISFFFCVKIQSNHVLILCLRSIAITDYFTSLPRSVRQWTKKGRDKGDHTFLNIKKRSPVSHPFSAFDGVISWLLNRASTIIVILGRAIIAIIALSYRDDLMSNIMILKIYGVYYTGCSLNIVFFLQEFSKVRHLSLASTRLLLIVQKNN